MLKVSWIESNGESRLENNYNTHSEVFVSTRASFEKDLEFSDLLYNMMSNVKQLFIAIQRKVPITQPGL